MSHFGTGGLGPGDTAPGDQRLDGAEITAGVKSYLIGLGLAVLLTATSFFIARTTLVWEPSIPVALIVLAIAQMGVHLVFFLHITTGPDNVNNVMALAFGVLIVLLLLAGSLWIMSHLNQNMGYEGEAVQMQMQPEGASPLGSVTGRGIVGRAETVPLRARISGVIEAVYCNAKTRVKAGQSCAKIDPRPYQILIDKNRAGLQALDARLEEDRSALAKAKAAVETHEAGRGAKARKELGKARSVLEKAQARMSRDETKAGELQAALHAAETSLGHIDIVAPADGIVVARAIEPGQRVAPDSATPLFALAPDPALAKIDATIGTDGSKIKTGDTAMVTLEAFPDHQFPGTVTDIRPKPQSAGAAAAFAAVISVPDPSLALQEGMAVTVRIAPE